MSVAQAAVLQNVGLGLETTPGTKVPVTHRMGAMGIEPAVQLNDETYGPMGIKADTMVILNQEWVQAAINGKPSFTEIIFPLSGIITQVTPDQVEVETDEETDPGPTTELVDAWDWEFESEMYDVNDPATFTIQQLGRGGYAQEFGYGLLTDFGMNIGRTSTAITGTMVGQAFETGVEPFDPTELTMLDLVPIIPGQFNIYLDDVHTDFGSTQLLQGYTANWSIGQKYGMDWPLVRENPSFSRHIDLKPVVTLQIQMQRDAVGMSPLGRLRNGQKSFLRVEALGPVLDTYTFTPDVGEPVVMSVYNRFQLDFCGIGRAPSEGEIGGNKTITWTFTSILDNAWGKSYVARVRNGVSSLTA